MSTVRIALAILVASAVLLAVGVGTRAAGTFHTLPPEGRPVTIPYAGRLAGDSGQPVAEGAYDLTFALYAAESGGEPLWSEVQAGAPVKGGSFSVSLGSATPIPPALFDGRTLWLAVAVRGPGEPGFTALTPRQRVSAAASDSLRSPTSVAANAACPHDHFGELWSGSTATDGLWIYNSGTGDGLQVDSEGSNGVLVYHAASVGMQVYEAGNDGVYVGSAGDDGMYVNEAGSPGATSPSPNKNGFEVAGAEESGLYVGYAGLDGVTVHSAEWYGVYVEQSDSDGVRVQAASGNGVTGISVSDMYYGGLFRNDVAGGAGLYAAGGDNAAPDLVLGVYGSGDDGRIYSYPEMTSSDLLLFSNDEAHIHLDEDDDESGTFVIYNGANTAVWTVGEKGAVTFGTEAGTYGPRSTYPVRATGDWIEDFGTAQLMDGQATVTIEPVFSQMVSLAEYQVYLTALCQEPILLFVAGKTPTAFAVRGVTLDGRPSQCAFDYRLVAKRLGYEGVRLAPAEAGGEEENND